MRYYDGLEYIDADQYYNETFGGGEQWCGYLES
jgi:hypothetical protein